MSRDILGSLVRALVIVPENRLGLVRDFVNKMTGSDGETWEIQGKLFLRKQPTSWEVKAPVALASVVVPEPETVINPTIRVDRSIRPSYPDWVKTVMHPELEPTGPAEYDISKIDQWLHEGQKDGKWTSGNNVYAKLKEKDMKLLKGCLGLRDLEDIQKKGIAFFRKYFKGKAIFAWSAVVRDRGDHLYVPYLCGYDVEVVLDWSWLANDWHDDNPALRHAS
ncbi:MAG: hypothetical protein Q7R72_01415 [bacterium]|nr:hypothetical protein [bacterium]